jgi:hypothetical protein
MNLAVKRLGLLGLFAFGGTAGCGGPEEPDWQFDQADMEAALFGTWSGTITPVGEVTVPFMVTLRSHDDVARAPACGNRDFSGDDATPGLGARCIEVTSLAVSATIVGDGAESEDADGSFGVLGVTLDNGDLSLDYRSASRWMVASWSDDDGWSHCAVTSDEQAAATCTMDERAD